MSDQGELKKINEILLSEKSKNERIEKALEQLIGKDSLLQNQGFEQIKDITDTPKKVLRDRLREKERESVDFEVKKINKIKPQNPESYTQFRFFVEVEGEEHNFKIDSDDLWTQRVFSTKLLEITNRKLKWKGEEFDKKLNNWLENCMGEEIIEAPITRENVVVDRILNNLNNMEPTLDKREATVNARNYYYLPEKDPNSSYDDPVENEIWINNAFIHEVVDNSNVDIKNMNVIKGLLDPVLSGSAKKVRVEGGTQTFWRFDLEALERVENLKLDTLEDQGEEDETREEKIEELPLGGESEDVQTTE